MTDLEKLDPSTLDLAPKRDDATLRFLLTRRSTPARTLTAPGPSDAELALILKAAVRVPDHGKLTPWRFVLVGPAARARLSDAIRARGAVLGMAPDAVEKAAKGVLDGPRLVAVVSTPKTGAGIPEVEQLLSAGAVCGTLVNAALASGYGANWLSGWPSYDETLTREQLGVTPPERVVGLVHIGTASASPPERPRPDAETLLTRLD